MSARTPLAQAFMDAIIGGRPHTHEQWGAYLEDFHSRNPSANGLFMLMQTYAGKTTYEALAHAVAADNPRRVLEVGCGDGNLMDYLPDFIPNARIVGVDFAQGEIDIATERFSGNEHLSFQRADATRLPFDDGSFDAVASHQYLNFAPSVDQAMREMLRVLRPGGVLHVATNRGWLTKRDHIWIYLYDAAMAAARAVHPSITYPTMSDKRIYSDEGIEEIVREHPSLRMSTLSTTVIYPSAQMAPERVAEMYNRLYVLEALPGRASILEAVTAKARELAAGEDVLTVELPFRLISVRKSLGAA